jgi:hypothetical protein
LAVRENMKSTNNWWRADVDWNTPAGKLLKEFVSLLPPERHFNLTLYNSAPLQLTVDKTLLSGDVDFFSDDESDIAAIISEKKLGKEHQGPVHLEPGFELSFCTSPRWRTRAEKVRIGNVTLTIPHPLDILIGKLARFDPKDLTAFRRVIAATGHPTADELKLELQYAVDLFRPNFNEESPNRFRENTEQLWREVFQQPIDVQREIIEPAIARRKQGYGEESSDDKGILREI